MGQMAYSRHCRRTGPVWAPAVAFVLCLSMTERCAGTSDPIDVAGQANVVPAQAIGTNAHDIVVAPIPISNPTVGNGLALTAMFLYRTDAQSPESFTALGGGYTSSNSWLVAAAEKLSFDADRYRLMAGAGYGELNYDFFGVGAESSNVSVPVQQEAFGGMLDFRVRVYRSLHVGLRWTYGDVKTSVRGAPGPYAPLLEGRQLDLVMSGLGLVASWDTRDRSFAPTRGTYAELKTNFASPALGSDLAFQTYGASWNAYYPLGAPNILAARVYLCKASSSAPFFETCAYGSGTDLRGYEAGRYRDRNMVAAQTEYRINFSRRFGAVGFAGVGSVAGTFGALFTSTLLPDVGVGLRFLAVPSQGVSISADYAWGRSGSRGAYVYIGDSF